MDIRRPYMPGYGIAGPEEGTGLLPWSWAEERLRTSHDYWLATTWPDGRPHVMPVWAVWDDASLWFSAALGSRKSRNLLADPRCVATTDDPLEPVVVEGVAERVTETTALQSVLDLINPKYETSYALDFLDPTVNATFRIRPVWAFGLIERDFTGSPTRWRFGTP